MGSVAARGGTGTLSRSRGALLRRPSVFLKGQADIHWQGTGNLIIQNYQDPIYCSVLAKYSESLFRKHISYCSLTWHTQTVGIGVLVLPDHLLEEGLS